MNREIQKELMELGSRLAALPTLQPYAPPQDGYFAALSAALAAHAAPDMLSAPDFGRSMPFATPPGYLETLPEQLLMAAQSGADAAPQAPYEVPANYLNTLPAMMLEAARKAEKPRSSRSIAFSGRRAGWLAAAAAAVGIWFGVTSIPATPSADLRAEAALAGLATDSIGAYVERHAEEFDPESLEVSLAGTQVTDFRKVVSELRSDEIEDYLNDDETPDGI